jgi:thymidine phosphorylase
MIVVPILSALGVTTPKTSSRAITSASGTADTMGVLADVSLSADRIHDVVDATGGCIVWGGALELAPADDVLITVERPMGIDTEAQMIASILSKKVTAGASHALIDIPVGPTAKVRSHRQAQHLSQAFSAVAVEVGIGIDVVVTEARGPIGRGVGPRLEALDVLAVLGREAGAPRDLREKSLFLAGRLLERTGAVENAGGYRAAQRTLDSGAALAKLEEIIVAQGEAGLPDAAPFQERVASHRDGRIAAIDCLEINSIAKLAGAPANPAAGLRLLQGVGDVVAVGDPLLELHAQSREQLKFAVEYARRTGTLFDFGY